MDPLYRQRLQRVARYPDSDFPEILMEPRYNDFDEDDLRYHTMDLDDASNAAVSVDPRFTSANITAMRPTAKSMAKFLDWASLWDDYMIYLEDKYGSIEIAHEMYKMGLMGDPWPGCKRRPEIRNKELNKALKVGSVPSFFPTFCNSKEERDKWIQWMVHVNEVSMPDVTGLPEPDPEYRKELTKEDIEYNREMFEKMRRLSRLDMLGRSAYPSGAVAQTRWHPGIDFIEQFYRDQEAGLFEDPEFTDYRFGGIIETEMRLQLEEELMTESDRILKERRAKEGRESGLSLFFRDGRIERKNDDEYDEIEFFKHLQNEFGIDIYAAMQEGGMKKRGIKAVRVMLQDAGVDTKMSKKQMKKAKRARKKMDRTNERIVHGSDALSALLKTNRLLMNHGTLSFEDGWTLGGFDDDED